MGGAGSTIYNFARRQILRYNIESRTHKFLDRDKLPTAPRYTEIDVHSIIKDNPQLKAELEELKVKNKQLDEYLKKVYITSTDVGKKVVSSRPLPTNRSNSSELIFYEPETPEPKCLTLTQIVNILLNYPNHPDFRNLSKVAEDHKVDKQTLVHLLTYYSLFRREKFDFMNNDRNDSQENEKEKKIMSGSENVSLLKSGKDS